MKLASEKGSSISLTVLPLSEHGFALHKGAFHDALALRYGWTPDRLPSKCDCGVSFSVEHALSCPKGEFPSIRQNEIRDLTATLLTEVCNDMCIEPELQPVTDEELTSATANSQAGARLDIAAKGVWGGTFERTYFDVRVFNPHAPFPTKTGHKIEKKLHILSCCDVWSNRVFKTKGARSKQQKLSHIPTHNTYHAAKEKVVAAILHLKLPHKNGT